MKATFKGQYKKDEEWENCKIVFPIGAMLYSDDSDIVKLSNGIDIYANLPVFYKGEVGLFYKEQFKKQNI